MKFNLNDFIELDTKELLGVNGGGGCSGTSSLIGGKSDSGKQDCKKTGSGKEISGGGNCSSVSAGSGMMPATDKTKTAPEKMMEAIAKKRTAPLNGSENDSGEKKGAYVKGSYECDDYVEEMVKNAGYKSKDYYIDNPNGKDVDKHIKELKDSGKSYETDSSKLTEGAYVVFMSDEQKVSRSHAALLFVNSDGSAFMYDNSSHNFYKETINKVKYYYGGIEKTPGNSAQAVCNQYSSYENFYFQKIN
ncbi:MAG: hypothetical protein ACTTKX_06750 [Treponema sp.]